MLDKFYKLDDDIKTVVVIAAIATPLAGLLFWGLSPAYSTTVAARYGNWETQVFLKKEYTDCMPIPDGNGGSFISCDTSWRTIDQLYENGHCQSHSDCHAAFYPTIPEIWHEQAQRRDIKIDSRGRFTITFQDESDKLIHKDYTETEYSTRMPADLDSWFRVTVNNFGEYSKP